jgi:hypothetical protein
MLDNILNQMPFLKAFRLRLGRPAVFVERSIDVLESKVMVFKSG